MHHSPLAPGTRYLCLLFAAFSVTVRADELPATRCDDGTPVAISPAATIGELRIENRDVFDLDDPAESHRLYRLANDLHYRTRPSVIESRLLFAAGDPFSLRLMHESERLLRSARYLYDAHICVLAYHDDVVDLAVQSRDVWTLRPGLSFSRSGGENEFGISLEDENLLGTGIAVSLGREHHVDRDSTTFDFTNRNLFGRWLTLAASFADNSDGRSASLTLEQPFYSLDTRLARGVSVIDDDRIDPLYDRGEIVDEFRHETSYQRAYWGWSPGLGAKTATGERAPAQAPASWARRWTVGVVRDFEHFSPSDEPGATTLLPEDRELQYPFFGFELLRDHFIVARNHNQIDRTEDFFLGPRVYAEVGLLQKTLGSDRDGLVFDSLWSYGRQPGDASKWLAQASWSERAETGLQLENSIASASFKYYVRQSPRRLLFASLQADLARDLDLDNQLLLGGDNGLRGYPLRYAGGDRRALFTIEQRYFTSWYPFRLFHVAGAAFFDVGRAWGTNPLAEDDPGWLRDIGVGLRFSSSRSGTGTMIHVDFAIPLDGDSSIDQMQLVIETKHGF